MTEAINSAIEYANLHNEVCEVFYVRNEWFFTSLTIEQIINHFQDKQRSRIIIIPH